MIQFGNAMGPIDVRWNGRRGGSSRRWKCGQAAGISAVGERFWHRVQEKTIHPRL